MTREPIVSAEQAARHELIQRLQEMSTALQVGDDALFQERLHALLRRREESFYTRIARITDDLKRAFESLEADQKWNAIASELPDAGARLEHVSQMTERAAHHTLDLVEAGQRELRALNESLAPLAPLRARLRMAAAGSGALMSLADEVEGLEGRLTAHHTTLRGTLSSLAQSQEYQDLSGQILRRVTHVVREVEAALLKLLDGRLPAQANALADDKGLDGPAVPGVGRSETAAKQDDADALLAMFDL
jgi:chemotaxis protein CheZ